MKRRIFITSLLSGAAVAIMPRSAFAITEASARKLVNSLVGEINAVIAAGKPDTAMFRDFERILVRYADMPTISQATLGADGRGAPASVKSAYQDALQGYIARKYGKQFREIIDGQIEVVSVAQVNRYFEVKCMATLRGSDPFEIDFLVSNRSGKDLFFDLKIEGVSLLLSERREIGGLLDRRRGDISAVTNDLKSLG